MATFSPIPVNSLVKIDGKTKGRVTDIIQPLGSYNLFVIRTEAGTIEQIPRYRLRVLPETVATISDPIGEVSLPQHVIDDILNDDFFSEQQQTVQRFQQVSNHQIDDFLKENENKNTSNKTKYDTKVLRQYMASVENDHRELESIPPIELNVLLCKFFIGVRKSNGEEYEPSSLRCMLSSFDRYLRQKNYGVSLIVDPIFSQSRDVLTSKQKHLKREGKGNLPKSAEAISDEELEQLWSSGKLGLSNPESLLNLMWWNNTVHFGMRSVTPHRQMCWGDISLKTGTDGIEFLEMNERQTKTRTGANIRDVRRLQPRVWATPTNPDRCPVQAFKKFQSVRPVEFCKPDSPFYLATACKVSPLPGQIWFKRQPVGRNKLASIMKNMVSSSNLSSDKRITNHSARKHLIQKMQNNDIAPTHIMQISGHKNVQSVNNYSTISETQHRLYSNLLTKSNSNSDLDRNSALTLQTNPCPVSSSPKSSAISRQHSQNLSQSLCSSVSKTSDVVHTLFAGPIYGGVFNITIGSGAGVSECKLPTSPQAKHRRIQRPLDLSSDDE